MTARQPTRKLTLYRDDSTVQVVYEDVKAVFWTAGNTVVAFPGGVGTAHMVKLANMAGIEVVNG